MISPVSRKVIPESAGLLDELSSVTHSFNMSQLIYPVVFTATSSTSLRATAPPNAKAAPPGPYMLFLINTSGVPSVAKIIKINHQLQQCRGVTRSIVDVEADQL